jgi:hypothetical protein
MTGIKCGQCGHDNDLTRVFCQNCGTRLERGDQTPVAAGPSVTPVPVKRKSKSQGPSAIAMIGQLLRAIVSIAFFGAVLALFIQLGRAPEGIPAASTTIDEAAASGLYDALKAVTVSPFRRPPMEIKQEQINNYLASRLTSASSSGPSLGAQFVRVFVVLNDGSFQFYVERKYLGLSVYFRIDCEPLSSQEGASAIVKGGAIGHVPLHPVILRLVQARVITPAVDALSEQLDILRKADDVKIKQGAAFIGWPGTPTRR